MRLLLINPRFPESFWSYRWMLSTIMPGQRAINPPLGLATLAALCPPHWDVEIVDENIEPTPLLPEADIVGVCGMGIQFPRQKELLSYYRARGHYVVSGGSYGSLCPEQYKELADSVVAGEAEYIWRQFCADFEQRLAQTAVPRDRHGQVRLIPPRHASICSSWSIIPVPRYNSHAAAHSAASSATS